MKKKTLVEFLYTDTSHPRSRKAAVLTKQLESIIQSAKETWPERANKLLETAIEGSRYITPRFQERWLEIQTKINDLLLAQVYLCSRFAKDHKSRPDLLEMIEVALMTAVFASRQLALEQVPQKYRGRARRLLQSFEHYYFNCVLADPAKAKESPFIHAERFLRMAGATRARSSDGRLRGPAPGEQYEAALKVFEREKKRHPSWIRAHLVRMVCKKLVSNHRPLTRQGQIIEKRFDTGIRRQEFRRNEKRSRRSARKKKNLPRD